MVVKRDFSRYPAAHGEAAEVYVRQSTVGNKGLNGGGLVGDGIAKSCLLV